ncbi:MFS transporter [Paraburkholderia sediminicola]|uniref:MFS transporter n=1 Tax=Paraburkholderia metrosideri TaxID=580937 RepID=A0ABW9E5N6_9BURK
MRETELPEWRKNMNGTPVTYNDVSTKSSTGKLKNSLFVSVTGNALEWFDWTIYASFAPFIAKTMFSPSNATSALLQTLGIFAVGFLARPFGGVLFARTADRSGRRTALVLTMSLMAVGSLVIAFIPPYARIGIFSSILLLIARLVQGLAHGGESGASYVYVSELAPAKNRGLWSSTVFMGISAGVMLGSLFGVVLTRTLSTGQLLEWGWRVPFIAGALLGIFAFYLRRKTVETEVFRQQSVETPVATPSRGAKEKVHGAIKLFFLLGATNVAYYTWLSFASTYAISSKKVSPADAFTASLAAQFVGFLALPLFGWLSDRIGRKPMALLTTVGFAAFSFPLDAIFSNNSWTLFASQSAALVIFAAVGSIYPAIMAEQFSTANRTLGVGSVSSIAAVIFGGPAPYLNSWLTSIGYHWLFTAYTVALNAIAAVFIVYMTETKGMDLRRKTIA